MDISKKIIKEAVSYNNYRLELTPDPNEKPETCWSPNGEEEWKEEVWLTEVYYNGENKYFKILFSVECFDWHDRNTGEKSSERQSDFQDLDIDKARLTDTQKKEVNAFVSYVKKLERVE